MLSNSRAVHKSMVDINGVMSIALHFEAAGEIPLIVKVSEP